MGTQPTVRMALAIGAIVYCALCLSGLPGGFVHPAAAAAEFWADSGLPVTTGLAVWLDASAENRARKQLNQPELRDADSVEIWHDASGNHRDVVQENPAARPRIRLDGKKAFVQFDGQAACLARVAAPWELREITVIVAAAPHDNPGDFTGLVAANAEGKNDFVSGLNIDLGPAATDQFDVLNVEGAGFGGAQNLKSGRTSFSRLHRLCLVSAPGKTATQLWVNGQAAGARDRKAKNIHLQRLTVGARFYAHGQPPQTCGFLHGEIAELLIYDRRLGAEEIAAVDRYLLEKFGDLREIPLPPPAAGSKRLERIANPPPVQVFVPGFVVRALPLELPNVNNVLYREDGALVTLGYDGNVRLLSDSDGDGLEDRARLFWENKGTIRDSIGMALTLPGDQRGRGVLITSRSKCLMVLDTDADDVADRELVVAEGWKETTQGIDACGVVVDLRDGSIYFGLGCADYTNGHQVGSDGQARYNVQAERGTILHVAPDLKSRQIHCSGIRFPVGIRFNHLGDLFCTDQEGATWLPNGNPFDELLHIEHGRHYGFPPRHPRHLPDVIDEPSVFDYRPQHQSTCGLNFNEPVNGGPIFGPEAWRHDAFVAGYSRGKIYRTQLVKTAAGYVAQNHLLATLNMLTADVCVSPQGALVVAAHSGGPDWGSGPKGTGRLYKIVYADRQAPQPVAIWMQTPRELRIAFDHELQPETLRDLAARAAIDAGQFVAAGDRFESLRPGYAVVANQLRAGRFDVKVLGVKLLADRRTLIITTAPHAAAVNYAIKLPGIRGSAETADATAAALSQLPDIDLQYDLSGVEARWQAPDGATRWQGWLPHVDLEVARQLTRGSAAHDELWDMLAGPGTLTLKTQLNLKDMLRPAVQPGSRIDYEPPDEQVSIILTAPAALTAALDGTTATPTAGSAGTQATFALSVARDRPTHLLELQLATGSAQPAPRLTIDYHTADDPRRRALPLARLLLPWAALTSDAAPAFDNRDLPELAGGNWLRGRGVFLSEEASCSKCHRAAGLGGAIGPDLSNLVHRDYDSVLRDISQPSFAINPDYLTQVVALEDGRLLTGALRTRGNTLVVGDAEGRETTVAKSDVSEVHPSPLSIMPQDLPQKLGPEKLRDLLTFLLTEPPRMPDYGKAEPPPPRTFAEVDAVLAGAPAETSTRPLHIVLVAGPKDHGPGEHDYPAWQRVWQRLLALAPAVRVSVADNWPADDDWKTADAMVFYQRGDWTPERARAVDAFLARGGGLVYIHWAVDGRGDAPGFARRIGLAWGADSKYRHGPLDLQFALPAEHPIARNFDKLHLHDESYWNGVGDVSRIRVLASGIEEGQPRPLFWTIEHGAGRVFVSIPGHFAWTFDDPHYRVLLLRGIAWTAHEPVDRFNELVWPGARVAEGK